MELCILNFSLAAHLSLNEAVFLLQKQTIICTVKKIRRTIWFSFKDKIFEECFKFH